MLYQLSVQDTSTEIRFINRIFRKQRGRAPLALREDFCGTALLCADWVKQKDRTATGIDLDPEVLAWGIEHNLAPIGEPGNRIRLLQQDVRRPCGHGPFDVTVGLNFSYFVFRTRAELRSYFQSVHRSLAKDGLFFLDAYGGYEAIEPMEEPRKVDGGFTYVWDQARFNPVTHEAVNHIHFEFRDGSKMRKAFTYSWRFWTLPEIREVLEEAGFRKTTVYWEDADEDGEGTGVFRPRENVQNEASWVAYIVAER